MIIKIFISTSLLWFGLVGCTSKNPNEHVLGNTIGNLNNYGIYAEQDGWIYFADNMNGGKLTKIKEDLSYHTVLTDEPVFNINIVSEWIYFSVDQDFRVFRMKNDGSERQQIGNITSILNIIVEGDVLFFANLLDEDKLYRINVDGSGLKKLTNSTIFKLTIEFDWIYYTSVKTVYPDEPNEVVTFSIRKVMKDGSSDTLVFKDGGRNLIAYEGWLYFTSVPNGNRLYRVRYDGRDNTRISDDLISELSLVGNRLFYSTEDSGVLISCEFDGRDSHVLLSAMYPSRLTGIIGDWIYIERFDLKRRVYRITRDGKEIANFTNDE